MLRVGGMVVDYAAPDRTEVRFVNAREVVIGRTLYVTHSPVGPRARWTKSRLANLDVPFAPVGVRRLLAPYLTARSVVRRGDGFEVRLVVPASDLVPAEAGRALVTATLSIEDGAVVGVRSVAHGLLRVALRREASRGPAGRGLLRVLVARPTPAHRDRPR